MKRVSMFFVLFLTALCCTLTVSAADYAIHSVTIRGNAVQVSVTAESDCALTAAVYDADGRMLSVQARNVVAGSGQDVSLTIAGGIPAGSAAKAFLTGADSKPLCAAVSSSNGGGDTPTTGNVYAILYADGTLVFQHGNTPQSGREVRETYAVDMKEDYTQSNKVPWRNARAFIYQVDFTDKIQPMSTAFWFEECTKLKEISNIQNLDTSKVTNMDSMFARCGQLAALDVSHFNTENVADMHAMFYYCGKITALNVSAFNTANVKDMSWMFFDCGVLTTLDVSNFDTTNVTNMASMFGGCRKLTMLDVSHFNTAKVTDMLQMFDDCCSLMTLDVSNFDTLSTT